MSVTSITTKNQNLYGQSLPEDVNIKDAIKSYIGIS